MTSSIDHRISDRIDLKIEIGIGSPNNFFTGYALNISQGGLFVATHLPEAVGSHLSLRFTLPGAVREIQTSVKVAWVQEFNPMHPETQPGMGLQFINLSSKDREEVNEYMQNGQEPIFHPCDDSELP